MSLDEICAIPILNLASPDAVLFMWTTASHLQESFQVLAAWGFEYKTNAVWVKDKIGLGYFIRGQHEHLLIATRGDMPCPLPAIGRRRLSTRRAASTAASPTQPMK
jgi:N6-adenosine-specific RNA methylase IME4